MGKCKDQKLDNFNWLPNHIIRKATWIKYCFAANKYARSKKLLKQLSKFIYFQGK